MIPATTRPDPGIPERRPSGRPEWLDFLLTIWATFAFIGGFTGLVMLLQIWVSAGVALLIMFVATLHLVPVASWWIERGCRR